MTGCPTESTPARRVEKQGAAVWSAASIAALALLFFVLFGAPAEENSQSGDARRTPNGPSRRRRPATHNPDGCPKTKINSPRRGTCKYSGGQEAPAGSEWP